MRHILLSLLFFSLFVSNASAFDRVAERAYMMALLENLSAKPAESHNLGNASPQNAAFVRYFLSEVWPMLATSRRLESEYNLFFVARDRALYDSPEESEVWKQRQAKAKNELDSLKSSDEWKLKIQKFANMASLLDGELAALAKYLWIKIEIGQFEASTLPLQERATELEIAIQQIQNDSPIGEKLSEFEQRKADITEQYFKREISFEEATKMLDALVPISRGAKGLDVATKARELLHELAVVRTKLARSKKFDTWAQYQVAVQSLEHGDPFNSVKDRLNFLGQAQAQTLVPYRNFLERRMRAIPGLKLSKLRRSQFGLLGLPENVFLRPYLKKEHALPLWYEVMTESGFDPEMLRRINWDIYPRAGKQTHAYMANVNSRGPKVLTVDAVTLNIPQPLATGMDPADIFVVQNFQDDGMEAFHVTLHEGGHGEDYSEQWNVFGLERSYGWAETGSMTMESFEQEPEFLFRASLGQTERTLSEQTIQAYLVNKQVNELMQFRRQVALARTDLLMWDFAYEPGGENFVDRTMRIYDDELWNGLLMPPREDSLENGYSAFFSSHFISGEVRYIGYIQAYVSSAMTYHAILDKLEAQTGRRTLMRQPGLGPMLSDYYRTGSSQPFPKQVEAFTGKPFSATDYVAGLTQAVSNYSPGPYDFLTPPCGVSVGLTSPWTRLLPWNWFGSNPG